ncbi:MAG: thermonuclease family protein [Halanaeroarchaeum sp.]
MRLAVGAVLVLVMAAGCVSVGPLPGGNDAPARANATVTVTHVVDGDTIEVRFPDGSADTVRLLGIDAPETHVENEPDEFEGVPDTEAGRTCLRDAGRESGRWLADRVADDRVTLVFDPRADERGGYGRLLAYVHENGTDVGYRLVATGRARLYDGPFVRADRYRAAEDRAQDRGIGLWRCR